MKCKCGCGEFTKDPIKEYRPGHRPQSYEEILKRSKSRFRNSKTPDGHGYLIVRDGMCSINLEHRKIVEEVLGRKLLKKNRVHHINGNGADNRKENLVVCEDTAYHFLLHRREAALKACGNPFFRKCPVCQKWDDPINLKAYLNDSHVRHKACRNKMRRESNITKLAWNTRGGK